MLILCPHWGRALTPYSLRVGCTYWPASEENGMEGEKKGNFAVEKPGKYYLNQLININTKSCWLYVQLTWCDENGTLLF